MLSACRVMNRGGMFRSRRCPRCLKFKPRAQPTTKLRKRSAIFLRRMDRGCTCRVLLRKLMKKLILASVFAGLAFGQTYDIVLANGRVMDPDSGLDGIRNVGIRGGRVEALST